MENISLHHHHCKYVHHVETHLRCDFVNKVNDCLTSNGGLQYVKFIYCSLGEDGTSWAVAILLLWLGLLFVALGVTADDFLCPALIVITKTLGLTHNIAGITFLALGNGSPDILSAVVEILQGRESMVIGQLFGGGIFVTCIVAGSICMYKPFSLMQRPFLRDSIFYIVAIYWVFCVCYYGEISLLHSIGFLLYYCVYIVVVIAGRYIYKKYCKKCPSLQYDLTESSLKNKDAEKEDDQLPPEVDEDAVIEGVKLRRLSAPISLHHNDMFCSMGNLDQTEQSILIKEKGDDTMQEENKHRICKDFLYHLCPLNLKVWHEINYFWRGVEILKIPAYLLLNLTVPAVISERSKSNWCKCLNVLHCVTGPLFMIFVTHKAGFLVGGLFPIWAVIMLFSIVLAILVYFTSERDQPPVYHWAFGYFGFLVSIFWIYALAREITIVLKAVGIAFNITDVILGLTFMAWGNSIGDLISNLSVARQGFPRMGFSACYGSPMSTLLLGIGISFTIHSINENTPIKIQSSCLMMLLYGTLSLTVASTLVAMVILKFEIKRWFGIYLIIIYVVFLLFAVLMELHLIVGIT